MRRSSPELADVDDAARATTSAMVGAPGAGEQAAGVVAAEERRREVEDVAVDQAGGVEVVGHRGAALDQHLEDAPLPELVEDLAEVARRARAPGGPRRRRAALAEHDPQRARRRRPHRRAAGR